MAAILDSAAPVRQRVHWTDRTGHLALGAIALALAAVLAGPLIAILAQSIEDSRRAFVGLDNFFAYFGTPALAHSLLNSIWVSLLVTAIVLPAASCSPAPSRAVARPKGVFRTIALTPLLAPLAAPAISFIYWFGNQGVLKAGCWRSASSRSTARRGSCCRRSSAYSLTC